jgi:hypothetical protein
MRREDMLHKFAVGLISSKARHEYYCGSRDGVDTIINDFARSNESPLTGRCSVRYYPHDMAEEMITRVNEINADSPSLECKLIFI